MSEIKKKANRLSVVYIVCIFFIVACTLFNFAIKQMSSAHLKKLSTRVNSLSAHLKKLSTRGDSLLEVFSKMKESNSIGANPVKTYSELGTDSGLNFERIELQWYKKRLKVSLIPPSSNRYFCLWHAHNNKVFLGYSMNLFGYDSSFPNKPISNKENRRELSDLCKFLTEKLERKDSRYLCYDCYNANSEFVDSIISSYDKSGKNITLYSLIQHICKKNVMENNFKGSVIFNLDTMLVFRGPLVRFIDTFTNRYEFERGIDDLCETYCVPIEFFQMEDFRLFELYGHGRQSETLLRTVYYRNTTALISRKLRDKFRYKYEDNQYSDIFRKVRLDGHFSNRFIDIEYYHKQSKITKTHKADSLIRSGWLPLNYW